MRHVQMEDVICQHSYSTPLRNIKSTGKKAFLHVDFYISTREVSTGTVCYVHPGHSVLHGATAHLPHGQPACGQWPPIQVAGNLIKTTALTGLVNIQKLWARCQIPFFFFFFSLGKRPMQNEGTSQDIRLPCFFVPALEVL